MSQRTTFQTTPIVSKKMGKVARLPADKVGSFKFPTKVDPTAKSAYDDRSVSLISEKHFKRLYKGFRKEDLFIGSLKIL